MGRRPLEREADLLRALGHVTRLQVLEMLMARDTCFCDMQSTLQIEQATLSQHLQVLRRMGLVTSRKDGTKTIYRLLNPRLAGILRAATAACSRDDDTPAEGASHEREPGQEPR